MSLSVAVYACINTTDKVDLTSNWCISHQRQLTTQSVPKCFGHRSKAFPEVACTEPPEEQSLTSVPMARRKHLFSFRTQKLSSPAAIILRKWETSTVPNYKKDFRIGSPFSLAPMRRQDNPPLVIPGVLSLAASLEKVCKHTFFSFRC